MSYYEQQIIAATGCDPQVATILEDTMRHIIFHSTLNWQSKEQFDKGAREAYDVYLYEVGLDNPDHLRRFCKIWDAKFSAEASQHYLDWLTEDIMAWKAWEKYVRAFNLSTNEIKQML